MIRFLGNANPPPAASHAMRKSFLVLFFKKEPLSYRSSGRNQAQAPKAAPNVAPVAL